MSAVDQPRPARPLFDAEDAVRAVVDRLTIVEVFLAGARPCLLPDEMRGIERIVSDALDGARAVRAAWDAEYRKEKAS